jgi:hypothetical protein
MARWHGNSRSRSRGCWWLGEQRFSLGKSVGGGFRTVFATGALPYTPSLRSLGSFAVGFFSGLLEQPTQKC